MFSVSSRIQKLLAARQLFKGNPQSLGHGLRRVKYAMGALGEDMAHIPGQRLYAGENSSAVRINTGIMRRDCDFCTFDGTKLPSPKNEYCGTVLRITSSNTCRNPQVKNGSLLGILRTRFQSDAIKSSRGFIWNAPIRVDSTMNIRKYGSAYGVSMETNRKFNPKRINSTPPKKSDFTYKVKDHHCDLRFAHIDLPEYKTTKSLFLGNTTSGRYDGWSGSGGGI